MPFKDRNKRKVYIKNWMRNWRKNNPDKLREVLRKYRRKHPNIIRRLRKKSYWKNREKILIKQKEKSQERRKIVLTHYGGNPPVCNCCGEKIYEFLTLEHINGGGTKHRKKLGPANLTRFLIKNGFPLGYSVLCYNCNCAKAIDGICPHKQNKN